MVITLFSFLLALALIVYSQFYFIQVDPTFLAALIAFVGGLICLIQPFLQMIALIPLQKLEESLIPNVTNLYRQDRSLKLSHLLVYLFAIVSFGLAIALLSFQVAYPVWLLGGWLFVLGMALDLLRDQISLTGSIMNPFHAIQKIADEAKRAIQASDNEDFRTQLDTLTEVAVSSIGKGKVTLCSEAVNAFPPAMQVYFGASKSISQGIMPETGGKDEVGYTSFYLLQRLHLIHDKALQNHLEMISQQLITALGKIMVYGAEYDLSLVTSPARTLGTMAVKALNYDMNDAAIMANSTYLEASKQIINTVDLTYVELIHPFQAVISGLDAIAKTRFKRDKSSNIQQLVQPLYQLKELFRSEKMEKHRDTPAVVLKIDQVLAEFGALEQVMRAVPRP